MNRIYCIPFLFIFFFTSFYCFGKTENSLTKSLTQIGETAKRQPEKALKSLDSLKKQNKSLTGIEKIKLNEQYALCYYYKADFDKSKYYFEKTLSQSKAIKDSVFISKMYNNLGVLYAAFAKYDSALFYYNNSLKVKQKRNDTVHIAKTLMNMANVYNREGYYNSATQYYYQALRIFEQLKMKKEQAVTLNNIGTCQKSRAQYTKADSSLNEAFRIFSDLKNDEGKITALINIGAVQMDTKQDEKANDTFNHILQLAKKSKDSLSMAFAFINLGQIAIKKKDWLPAQKYINESSQLFKKNRYKEKYIASLGYRGIILFHLGQIKKGLQLLDSSFDILLKIKRFPLALKIGKKYSEYLMEAKNYKKAAEVSNKIRDLQYKIYNDKQARLTRDIEAKYHFEKQQKEIELSKKKVEALKAEKSLQQYRFRLYSVLGGGLLLLFIILILFVLYRNKQKRKMLLQKEEANKSRLEYEQLKNESLRQDLENKNKELTNFALHISEKKRFLQAISAEIKKSKSPVETKQIYIRIMQNLQSDKESEMLYKEVNAFLSKFSATLNNYSELTKKDIRLCTLIQLGLSSKDIASIFNISSKSVDMQRYRLRKKVNIPAEVSIEDWLNDVNHHN